MPRTYIANTTDPLLPAKKIDASSTYTGSLAPQDMNGTSRPVRSRSR